VLEIELHPRVGPVIQSCVQLMIMGFNIQENFDKRDKKKHR
jgi:hypothetical protein